MPLSETTYLVGTSEVVVWKSGVVIIRFNKRLFGKGQPKKKFSLHCRRIFGWFWYSYRGTGTTHREYESISRGDGNLSDIILHVVQIESGELMI